MPKFGLSQMIPLVVMLGINKFDPVKLGYVRHCEVAYAAVQVLCLGALLVVYSRINAMSDDGKNIKIKAVKQFGQVVKPAMEKTAKEYDLANWKEQLQKLVMGLVICSGVYYKWGSVTPLVLQLFMTPTQMFDSGLIRVHLRGLTVKRPYPAPNPLSMLMPSAPDEDDDDDATPQVADASGKTAVGDASEEDEGADAAPEAEPVASPPLVEGGFACEQRVEVVGLKGAPQHNGTLATVKSWRADKGRYVVELSSGEEAALRPANLIAVGAGLSDPESDSDGDISKLD